MFLSVAIVFVALAGVIWLVTQPVLGRERRIAPAVDPDAGRLERHVVTLAEDFFPRDFTHGEQLEKTAAYIEAALRETGARVSSQTVDIGGPGGQYRNVLASFGPESPRRGAGVTKSPRRGAGVTKSPRRGASATTPGPRIVVGAHYDAFDELPGADDNASAVAVLLELARLLGAGDAPATHTELVAYVLEEPPFFRTELMGSAVHAASLRDAGAEVRAMICLEMVGYFSDQPGSQQLPTPLLRPFFPDRGNFIGIVGNLGGGSLVRRVKRSFHAASSLPVRSLNGPRFIPGVDFSDHLPYWNAGFPAVMVTDTAFYRNLAYHTEEDTPDRLDYEKMAQVVLGVYQAVRSLDE